MAPKPHRPSPGSSVTAATSGWARVLPLGYALARWAARRTNVVRHRTHRRRGRMIEQLTHTVEDPIAGRAGLVSALRQYLEALLPEPSGPATTRLTSTGTGVLRAGVLETLASRELCSLSLGRVSPFRDAVVASVKRALHRVEPIHFYYGLGGGDATTICFGARAARS